MSLGLSYSKVQTISTLLCCLIKKEFNMILITLYLTSRVIDLYFIMANSAILYSPLVKFLNDLC